MYCVGNLPDHVTRQSHKNQSRWLVMTAPPARFSLWDVVDRVAVTLACTMIGAGLITAAVFILQGVA